MQGYRAKQWTLEQAQTIVELHAPHTYYAEQYRAMEAHYLPHLCELLEGYPPCKVLEVGPGWGTMLVWLAGRGHELRVVDVVRLGTFMTEDLLSLCSAEYIGADICAGPVPALVGWADVLIMTQVLPHLKWSPQQALRHACAMLCPKGVIIVTALDAVRHPHITKAATYGTDWRAVPEYRPTAPPPELVVCMFDRQGLEDLLNTVFTNVMIREYPWCGVLFGTAQRPGGDNDE